MQICDGLKLISIIVRTSVAAGSPRMKPRLQTAKVMEPSQALRPAGLMAMSPWMRVWKVARLCAMPSMMRER